MGKLRTDFTPLLTKSTSLRLSDTTFFAHCPKVPVTDVSIIDSKWVDYEPVQTGTNPI